ncbi:MAG: hypothetical protein NDI69_04915 [Bacteriovoracaceae bacterium]|nr:hypothetical protein [Bacteriovoracaceae bacterium]
MKFSFFRNGHMGLVLALSVLVSCNQDEFFPTEELIAGADAYCAKAVDLNSCQQMADVCQPAYEPSANEIDEPVYASCVANPDLWVTPPDGSDTIVDDGSSETPVDSEGSEGSEDPIITDGSGDPVVPGDSSDPVIDDPASAPAPTLDEAFASKCANLDDQYLLVKKIIKKKKVVNVVSKVKVCHMTGNGSSHTIVIACPALKAHAKHDDYLGACSL